MTCRSKSNKSKESPHVRHVLWNHWKLLCSRSVLASQCFCDISGAATGPFSPQKSIPGLGRCDEERVPRHPAGSSIGRPAIRKRTGLVKGTHTQKKGLRKKARRFSILNTYKIHQDSISIRMSSKHQWPTVNQSNAKVHLKWLRVVVGIGWRYHQHKLHRSWLNILNIYPQLAGQPPSKGFEGEIPFTSRLICFNHLNLIMLNFGWVLLLQTFETTFPHLLQQKRQKQFTTRYWKRTRKRANFPWLFWCLLIKVQMAVGIESFRQVEHLSQDASVRSWTAPGLRHPLVIPGTVS